MNMILAALIKVAAELFFGNQKNHFYSEI